MLFKLNRNPDGSGEHEWIEVLAVVPSYSKPAESQFVSGMQKVDSLFLCNTDQGPCCLDAMAVWGQVEDGEYDLA